MQVPTAVVTSKGNSSSVPERKQGTTRARAPKKALWKQDPRWIAYEHDHALHVDRLRKADVSDKDRYVEELRNLELQGKTLKDELKSFRAVSNQ